ncbi:MAG: hypothetical protein KDB03_02110 [Planctomycetales bacterium]|nr:hypothetical protein [Planctomycetales bacterium]
METDQDLRDKDRQWFIAIRWQEYEGESLANLLRLVAIGSFYSVQLINYYVVGQSSADALKFHQAATAIAVAWTLIAMAVQLCLRNQVFPSSLKYLSAGCDVLLLTALAAISESKANSPLIYAYFILLSLAGLRFSLRLVWFTTGGCMIAYLFLVAVSDSTWFDANHTVRPVEQLIVHLSLIICGVVIGQLVRRVKTLASHYANRLTARIAIHE